MHHIFPWHIAAHSGRNVGQKAPGPDPVTRLHQNRGVARRRAVQPSGPSFLATMYICRKDVRPTGGRGRRQCGQRGLRVGEQGTRGATRIVERGRGEAGGGGTRGITVHFSFIFPWSFICLSFVIQLLAVSERRLRLGGSGATHPFFVLFLHLLHATYLDHGNIHKYSGFPATTVPPKAPVMMCGFLAPTNRQTHR